MTTRSKQDLLAAAQRGEDIDDQPGFGPWVATEEPLLPSAHPDGAVLVSRSLRMTVDTYQRIKTAAQARDTTWSALIREWIDQGLAACEAGQTPDPITELHRTIDAATRALHALEHHPAAPSNLPTRSKPRRRVQTPLRPKC